MFNSNKRPQSFHDFDLPIEKQDPRETVLERAFVLKIVHTPYFNTLQTEKLFRRFYFKDRTQSCIRLYKKLCICENWCIDWYIYVCYVLDWKCFEKDWFQLKEKQVQLWEKEFQCSLQIRPRKLTSFALQSINADNFKIFN